MFCKICYDSGKSSYNNHNVRDFSGNIIREILDEIKLTDVFITNVVRCYPQNNIPLSSYRNNSLYTMKTDALDRKSLAQFYCVNILPEMEAYGVISQSGQKSLYNFTDNFFGFSQ